MITADQLLNEGDGLTVVSGWSVPEGIWLLLGKSSLLAEDGMFLRVKILLKLQVPPREMDSNDLYC